MDIRSLSNKVTLACIDDLERLTQILNQAIDWGNANAYSKNFKAEERIPWFKEHSQGEHCVYVYKENGEIMGYLSIGPYRKGRQAFDFTAEVSYYVDFAHHRKGVASALMDRAILHCKEKNIKTLVALLYGHNHPSIRFLKKYGFTIWGRLPAVAEVNGKEYDHVIYGKRIVF